MVITEVRILAKRTIFHISFLKKMREQNVKTQENQEHHHSIPNALLSCALNSLELTYAHEYTLY